MEKTIQTFISYSHDSEDHKLVVLGLANQLIEQGINCILDQYEESPEKGWLKWMELNIAKSAYVLVVCTKEYYEKFNSNYPGGKGVKWEEAIISQEIYDNEGENRRFIPIVFDTEDCKYIPRVLKPFTYYDVLDDSRYNCLYRRLTKQPLIKKPSLGNIIKFPTSKTLKNTKPKITTINSKSQNITGNNNTLVGEVHGNLSITTPLAPKINWLSPPGTIGGKPIIKTLDNR